MDSFGKREGVINVCIFNCILIGFAAFYAFKDLPRHNLYYTTVIKKIYEYLNKRKVPVF